MTMCIRTSTLSQVINKPTLLKIPRWERASDIRAALSEGRCVVVDRYSYSGIVYTASKEHPDPPSWKWCLQSEEDLPQPDLVFCLIPSSVDDLANRGGYGEERFENASFQTRVLANYRRLANDLEKKRNSGKAVPIWRWITVGKSDITEVLQMLVDAVREHSPGINDPRLPLEEN